ncbi:PDZ domain-containing protein MAGIX isoform X3 [Oenanthe melanoleuca]|uniref:PDZ domain-containing protein MAGIX isoform X3 n=1 Tax=Oenanthe melanoleuca TaxID=2939378 RepID=UPI0024C1847E|nr:PDZ domain-containing protein MAGIX isoform X3 [Oenanthe melanoleuca]
MPPPEAPPGPSVSVVVVVGGSCVLRYSRLPAPPPTPRPPRIPTRDGDLLLLLRSLGEELGSPSSAGTGQGYGLGWPQEPALFAVELPRGLVGLLVILEPAPFAVELPRGPGGFGFSLRGGPAGVFVRGLREGGPAQRCGCIQVSDELLAINGAPTAGMSHAQALARIRGGGGSRLRLLLRRPHGSPPSPLARGVLRLCVGSSPRGEPCFCLVGGLHP